MAGRHRAGAIARGRRGRRGILRGAAAVAVGGPGPAGGHRDAQGTDPGTDPGARPGHAGGVVGGRRPDRGPESVRRGRRGQLPGGPGRSRPGPVPGSPPRTGRAGHRPPGQRPATATGDRRPGGGGPGRRHAGDRRAEAGRCPRRAAPGADQGADRRLEEGAGTLQGAQKTFPAYRRVFDTAIKRERLAPKAKAAPAKTARLTPLEAEELAHLAVLATVLLQAPADGGSTTSRASTSGRRGS